MTQFVHFLNGEFVDEEHLLISPRDVGFSRAYAVFDFLVTYPHHRPFMLDRHLDRLFRSADDINLTLPFDKAQMKQWVHETLEKNTSPKEKTIKIMVTGGVSDSLSPSSEPTVIIIIGERDNWAMQFEAGTHAITARYHRDNATSKTTDYREALRLSQKAKEQGATEIIYYDEQQVYEGASNSIFALVDSRLVTTRSNVLQSITSQVLEEILQLDIPVVRDDFTHDQLTKADEVFLSSSGKEICPILTIDGKRVGSGEVGPITLEVIKQFRAYTNSHKWS